MAQAKAKVVKGENSSRAHSWSRGMGTRSGSVAAAGSAVVENVEADALSVSGAVGGSSLKQVTVGDLEIASALGSIKLEDVWADNYIKAGLILHTSGRIQKR